MWTLRTAGGPSHQKWSRVVLTACAARFAQVRPRVFRVQIPFSTVIIKTTHRLPPPSPCAPVCHLQPLNWPCMHSGPPPPQICHASTCMRVYVMDIGTDDAHACVRLSVAGVWASMVIDMCAVCGFCGLGQRQDTLRFPHADTADAVCV